GAVAEFPARGARPALFRVRMLTRLHPADDPTTGHTADRRLGMLRPLRIRPAGPFLPLPVRRCFSSPVGPGRSAGTSAPPLSRPHRPVLLLSSPLHSIRPSIRAGPGHHAEGPRDGRPRAGVPSAVDESVGVPPLGGRRRLEALLQHGDPREGSPALILFIILVTRSSTWKDESCDPDEPVSL